MAQKSDEPSPEQPARRIQWFEHYTETLFNNSIHLPEQDQPYPCPCCGYLTLGSRGDYDICAVCFWEDDGQDEHDADAIRGGPNGRLSLTQARQNFTAFGACETRMLSHVRDPLPAEHPINDQH
jgi:hypothetical protein